MNSHPCSIAVAVLESLGEQLQMHESVVTQAMNPLWRPPGGLGREEFMEQFERENECRQDVATVLRTGGLFVFSREDIPPFERLATDALPPLPFPRMWLEVSDAEPGEVFFRDIDGRLSFLLGFAVVERQRAAEWQIFCVMLDRENLSVVSETRPDLGVVNVATVLIRRYALRRDTDQGGKIGLRVSEQDIETLNAMDVADADRIRGVLETPEYLVQLVHTLGASVSLTSVSRPDRRRFQRRYGIEHPNVYRVVLGHIGEDITAGGAPGEFRHRWLVRGHYRRHPRGEHVVPDKGLCTWVRPYVKGPAGAPWKGRPVYHVAAAA